MTLNELLLATKQKLLPQKINLQIKTANLLSNLS